MDTQRSSSGLFSFYHYAACNPVAAGLVAKPQQWPGLIAYNPGEEDLNEDTSSDCISHPISLNFRGGRISENRICVTPEAIYSSWLTDTALSESGKLQLSIIDAVAGWCC